MIELYTIGFTKKSARYFFETLSSNQVMKIIDVRINNTSQLSGFAKSNDLMYFANEICKIGYEHMVNLAPTKSMLSRYRKGELTWSQYEIEYLDLLDSRSISDQLDIQSLHKCCFLCSEHEATMCHRRLLVEYIQRSNSDISVVHLR